MTPPAGPERIAFLSLEESSIGESAIGAHEHEARPGPALCAQGLRDLVDIAAEDWGEVGINTTAVSPRATRRERGLDSWLVDT